MVEYLHRYWKKGKDCFLVSYKNFTWKYKQALLWLSSGEGLFKHDIKNTNHVGTSKNNTKPVSKKEKHW